MNSHTSGISDPISELYRLLSLVIREEAFLEDQKSLLAENNSFYPESAFTYLKNYQIFINHSVSREKEGSEAINVFDPNFLSQTQIEVTEKKFLSYENLRFFMKFNDCNEVELTDLEMFKNFYFPSPEKGLDYQSFVSLFLPYSNRTLKKNCLKRKILYEVKTLESINLDLRLQNLMAQILEDELQLFKRLEEIKVKLANELHWDPVEAFNNLDHNSLSYLDLSSLEVFFQKFGEKFSPKDFQFLLKRINKNIDSEYIYFEDFKRLVLPFKTYSSLYEKNQSSQILCTKSQVMMERVDQAINDDKYLILKSTIKGDQNNMSRVSQAQSPSKIRQAVFDESALDHNKNQLFLSANNSKFISRAKPNVSVSGILTASMKPLQNEAGKSSMYVSRNDVAGKSMMYSRLPQNKIIQDLYGEHKFTNLSANPHTPMNNLPFPIEQQHNATSQQIPNVGGIVNPSTNFDNERVLQGKVHEKSIYTPIRQNPQLLLSLNNEVAIKSQTFGSPLLYSRAKKPLFYSNSKEMQNSNFNNNLNVSNFNSNQNNYQRVLSDAGKMQQSMMLINQSASPQRSRKIFDAGNIKTSTFLGDTSNAVVSKSLGKLNEPEISKRQANEKDLKGNISKPTPHIVI